MPCTKLEPDISGVCRIAGTWPMMTQPAKAASMKTYRATKPVIWIEKSIVLSSFGSSRFHRCLGYRYLGCGFIGFVAGISLMLALIAVHLAVMGQNRFGEYLIVPVQGDDVVLHHQREERRDIFRVQFAGVLREQRRHVERRHDRHLADLRGLARSRVFAIAAAFG